MASATVWPLRGFLSSSVPTGVPMTDSATSRDFCERGLV